MTISATPRQIMVTSKMGRNTYPIGKVRIEKTEIEVLFIFKNKVEFRISSPAMVKNIIASSLDDLASQLKALVQ